MSASLEQGIKFHKYQNKIIHRIEQKNKLEGFTSSYIDSSNQLLRETDIRNKESNLESLRKSYQETLNKYNTLMEKVYQSENDALKRTNPKNPLLNSFIKFPTGEISYVTNQGIAKRVQTQKVFQALAGKYGCPSSERLIPVTVPWSDAYSTSGATIPTNPPLLTGSRITHAQSCGLEGENVYVNKITDPSGTDASFFGLLGFIDANSFLSLYPSNNQKNTNQYTVMDGYDSQGNDIQKMENSVAEECEMVCNKNVNCAGFSFKESSDECWLKNNRIFPRQENPDITLYVREKTMIKPPIGAPSTVKLIDTAKFQHYAKESAMPTSTITHAQKEELEQIQVQLQLLTKQISQTTEELIQDNEEIHHQSQENTGGFQQYLKEISETEEKIKNMNTSIDNILETSYLQVLAKNSSFIFWSTLVVGAVITAVLLRPKPTK